MPCNLSKANINGMGMGRHPLYRREGQIFLLTPGMRLDSPTSRTMAVGAAVFLVFLTLSGDCMSAQEVPSTRGSAHTPITVNQESCRALVRYVDTGNATYQPGVDVFGRPVAGADLVDQAVVIAPSDVVFSLTIRLKDYAPGVAAALSDSTARIGEITVRGQEVLFNGQPLSANETAALAAACRQHVDNDAE